MSQNRAAKLRHATPLSGVQLHGIDKRDPRLQDLRILGRQLQRAAHAEKAL